MMVSEFQKALLENQAAFGISLNQKQIDGLEQYYGLVMDHNPILHLVAPCPPETFATRHILESLMLLDHLPNGANFADIGPGAGLPSIPCLIARADLKAVLIESKPKKVGFLQKVLDECKLQGRARIVNSAFEEAEKPRVSYVACRALDKFIPKLPKLIKWSGNCTLLLFGGKDMSANLEKQGIKHSSQLMPLSEQRYLFVSAKLQK
jgi:16S rRNA (guanine527-N7)-methyltransferase